MSNKKLLEPTEENFVVAAKCIEEGGVIVGPSDTNLALTLDPWNEEAIERAFAVKNRSANSALTLFFLEPNDWRKYAIAKDEDMVQALVDAFWPGPLNLILKKKDVVPDRMLCGGDTVALGCLSNPVWRGLMEKLTIPVTMTSANLSGQADGVLVDVNLALNQVGNNVDYILRGEAQGTTKSSTIIDLTGTPRITRLGDISAEQIKEVIGILPAIALAK